MDHGDSIPETNETNNTGFDATQIDVTAPSTSPTNSTVVASPISVKADGVSTSAVTVTLKNSTNNNPISGRSVTISSGTHVTTITPSSVATDPSGQATFAVKSVQEGVATITATDTTESVIITNTATIAFTDATPPNDVTGLAAIPGDTFVDLTWSASTSSDVAGYKVYMKVGTGSYDTGVDIGKVVSYQKTGLTNGTSYTFKVTAYDEVPNESAGVEVGPVIPKSWDKKFDGSGFDDTANSVAIAPDGSVYVVGHSNNLVTGTSDFDWWIKKFSSDGVEDTTNWNKMFDGGSGSGFFRDGANSVAIDPSGGSVYVAGYKRKVTGSPFDDWWIKKFSSSGIEDTASWNQTFDGSGFEDRANSVAVASGGSVYVVGYGDNLVVGNGR